jgi:mono/diheme cytochrome c family protein
MRRLGWLLGALTLSAAPAGAQDLPGDPDAGARFANEVCAACHIVGDDQTTMPGPAPTFFEIADHPTTTELGLRAFLQTPHVTMPDLLLTPDETDDVISYILALKGR